MTTVAETRNAPARRSGRPGRSAFHLVAALAIAAVTLGGFGWEAPEYFIHPRLHRPAIMFVHGAVFAAWIVLYLVQTALVRTGDVRMHRRLGLFGVALMLVMPFLGVATELTMLRFNVVNHNSDDIPKDLAFFAGAMADLIAFTGCAWAGALLRSRRDYHSRLMFLSTAALADNGVGRLPISGAGTWFYLSNLVLFGAGIAHDLRTRGRVHVVYLTAVPLILVIEFAAMWLWLTQPAWWVAAVKAMVGLT